MMPRYHRPQCCPRFHCFNTTRLSATLRHISVHKPFHVLDALQTPVVCAKSHLEEPWTLVIIVASCLRHPIARRRRSPGALLQYVYYLVFSNGELRSNLENYKRISLWATHRAINDVSVCAPWLLIMPWHNVASGEFSALRCLRECKILEWEALQRKKRRHRWLHM